MKGLNQGLHRADARPEQEDETFGLDDYRLGGTAPYHRSYAVADPPASDNSEDEILSIAEQGEVPCRQAQGEEPQGNDIRVTSRWEVSSDQHLEPGVMPIQYRTFG